MGSILKVKQISQPSLAELGTFLTRAGINADQLYYAAQKCLAFSEEVDNSESGRLVIDNPVSGTVYTALWPVTYIGIGDTEDPMHINLTFEAGSTSIAVNIERAIGTRVLYFQGHSPMWGNSNNLTATAGAWYSIDIHKDAGGNFIVTPAAATACFNLEEESE